jgi:hypothetical protein
LSLTKIQQHEYVDHQLGSSLSRTKTTNTEQTSSNDNQVTVTNAWQVTKEGVMAISFTIPTLPFVKNRWLPTPWRKPSMTAPAVI